MIYLVRHAKAGHRERWTEPDELRPLTKSGWRQAEALVGLFDEQPFARLLSSPYVRCVQTFEPLAKARSLTIENADELAEGAPRAASVDLLLRSAADGTTVALSTHGDIIENVLDELSRREVPLDGPVALEKGSTWIIDVADGAFAGARYVPPPD
ncbi:MAG TPA: phosphoglycerate mutase family protein [Gaiellaceae bacterium]|nr:phosphoglycerate mutase family protein [Gaiellaceae bacterium]